MQKKTKQSGFSMIELMIVVAIIGILASIAYTGYTRSVLKSGRSDAKVELNSVAQRLQRCFSTASTYMPAAGRCGVVDELNLGPVQSTERLYFITLFAVTPTTFTLQALPNPASRQINDTECTGFQLTNSGLQTAFGPGADPTGECW